MTKGPVDPDYDPLAAGAECWRCPLVSDGVLVPPEIKAGTDVLFIGQEPTIEDADRLRPFVGADGLEFNRGLEAIGRRRAEASVTNAALCLPPTIKMDRYLQLLARKNREIEAENKARKKRGEDPQPKIRTPQECCRPRLQREIAGFSYAVPMGGYAAKSLLGDDVGILDVRGTFYELERPDNPRGALRVIPTVHPAFVRRSGRYRTPFHADLARIYRWKEGKLAWHDPEIVLYPSLDELSAFLDELEANGWGTFDTETVNPNEVRWSTWKAPEGLWLDVDLGTSADPDLPAASAMLRTWPVGPSYSDKGPEPLTAQLRTIQVGNRHKVMIVWVEGVEGAGDDGIGAPVYDPDTVAAMLELLRVRYFENPRVIKYGQNSGYYDYLVLRHNYLRMFGRPVEIAPHYDCIIVHRAIEPEHPHSLLFQGSFYTDVRNWKATHTATTTKSNEELGTYGGIDVAVTDICAHAEIEKALDLDLVGVIDEDMRFQRVCAGLHEVGMWADPDEAKRQHTKMQAWEREQTSAFYAAVLAAGIDPARFREAPDDPADLEEIERRLSDGELTQKQVDRLLARQRNITNKARLNPHSTQQMAQLLFEVWDLPPPENVQLKDLYTKSGDRSTNDAVLRAYVGDPTLSRAQRDAIHALRLLKRARKTDSTFIVPVMVGDDSFVWPDGRIRANWKAHGTAIGRPATDDPNLLNQPKAVRAIYTAEPGHAMVGADSGALHLRLMAARWKIPSLLQSYLNPETRRGVVIGPHESFAGMIFGDEFWNAPFGDWPSENAEKKWKGRAKECRDVGKTVRYAGAYSGGIGTIYREVTSAEDKETGKLIYPNMKMGRIEQIMEIWMDAEPEWHKGWAREKELWKRNGYMVRCPISNRMRPCADEKETDIINAVFLMMEVAVMEPAINGFVDEVPFGYAGPGTGLINTNYDSLTAEVPVADVPRVKAIMARLMNKKIDGFPVPFEGEVDVAYWEEDYVAMGQGRDAETLAKKGPRRPSWDLT